MEESFWNIWTVIGAIVVLGGGAWTGAKVAFVVTLILQGLFGRATQREQRHVVYVQPPQHNHNFNHNHYREAEVVDVTPRRY